MPDTVLDAEESAGNSVICGSHGLMLFRAPLREELSRTMKQPTSACLLCTTTFIPRLQWGCRPLQPGLFLFSPSFPFCLHTCQMCIRVDSFPAYSCSSSFVFQRWVSQEVSCMSNSVLLSAPWKAQTNKALFSRSLPDGSQVGHTLEGCGED